MTSVPETEAAGQTLIGTVLGGRYRIEALIGTGGMGAVYRAEHVHMRKTFAIKVLHREMTLFPEVVARFEREAVAAGRIEHPHVAAALDFGRLDDGSFYMVLEFVEGQSLAAVIRSLGTVPERRALRIAQQIAEALAAAHAAGIVHRDLKPDNVMLVEREGRPEMVKVLDFGIAKVQLGGSSGGSGEPALTQLGSIFGTPEYMSPEQAQGLEVDGRADLYTLGLILYEMLSGISPFRDEELVVVLTRQITVDPPPLPSSISEGTRELVQALLKKDPNARPKTAEEVSQRLSELLQAQSAVESGAVSKGPASSAHASPGPLSAQAAPASAPTASAGASPAASVASAPTMSAESVASAGAADAAHAQTALALPITARQPIASLLAFVRRARLDRPVAVSGYAVPLGALLAGGGVLVVVAALTTILVMLSGDKDDVTALASGSAVSAAPDSPDLLALVAKAEGGDREAITKLAARAPSKRTLIEWRALGHGYFRTGDPKAGLELYTEGLRFKRELAKDPLVLGDVRSAVAHPELRENALLLAARSLGQAGSDLLYDVWEHYKTSNPAVAKRAWELLEQEPAKFQRSPALSVALKLHAAMKRPKCSELRQLLSELGQHADARSLGLLNRLNDRRGCGFLGLGDCYSCLRRGKELTNALAAAKSRPAPSFDVLVRPAPSTSAPKPAPASSSAGR